jgi:hypothetical protein
MEVVQVVVVVVMMIAVSMTVLRNDGWETVATMA